MVFKMSKYLKKSRLGDGLNLINIILSILFTFANHIVADPVDLKYLYTFGVIFFLGHFFIEFYTSEQKLYFILSFRSLIECLTLVLPLLFWSNLNDHSQFLLQICPVTRIIATSKAEKLLLRYVNSTAPFLFRIVHSFVCLTIIMAALMKYVENEANQHGYHEWVYFMIVTISLVGFGDLYPQTNLGQFLVVLTILIVLIKLPSDIQRYRRARSFIPRQSSETSIQKSFRERPFVLVIGLEKMRSVIAFLEEFYHEDHGSRDTYCIFMMSKVNVEQIRNLKRNYEYSFLVHFKEADPKLEHNLSKVYAEEAKNILIANESDNDLSDDQNIHYFLSLKTYLKKREIQLNKASGSHAPCNRLMEKVYIQLDVPEHKQIFQTITSVDANKIVCVEELKHLMLGKTMFCPGVITLISSLITSTSIDTLPKRVYNQLASDGFLWQYLKCMQTELYRVPVDGKKLTRVLCRDLVLSIYEAQGDMMIAVVRDHEGVSKISLCNLESHLDESISHIYLISDKHPDPARLSTIYDSLAKTPDYELMTQDSFSYNQASLVQELVLKQNLRNMQYRAETHGIDSKGADSFYGIQINDEIFESLSNHVVIIGVKPYMRDIIRALRQDSLPRVIPIIILILNNRFEVESELKFISQFASVYIHNVDTLKPSIYVKCKFEKAQGVILLQNSSSLNSLFSDGESILIYNQLKQLYPNLCIVSEFSNNSSLNFIMKTNSSWMNRLGHQVSPQFASGEVFLRNFLNSLIVQTVYHPNIVSIILQLLLHSSASPANPLLAQSSVPASSTSLYMLRMPSNHDGISFDKLFDELLKKSILLIGIYHSIDSSDEPPTSLRRSRIRTAGHRRSRLSTRGSRFNLTQTQSHAIDDQRESHISSLRTENRIIPISTTRDSGNRIHMTDGDPPSPRRNRDQWRPSNKRMVMVRPSKDTLLTSKDLLYVIYDPGEVDLKSLEICKEEGISNQEKFQFYGAESNAPPDDFVSDDEDLFNVFSGLLRQKDLSTAKVIKK